MALQSHYAVIFYLFLSICQWNNFLFYIFFHLAEDSVSHGFNSYMTLLDFHIVIISIANTFRYSSIVVTELSSQPLFFRSKRRSTDNGEKKRKTKTIGALEYSINLFIKRPSKYFCTFICKINVNRRQNCWDVDAQNPLLH